MRRNGFKAKYLYRAKIGGQTTTFPVDTTEKYVREFAKHALRTGAMSVTLERAIRAGGYDGAFRELEVISVKRKAARRTPAAKTMSTAHKRQVDTSLKVYIDRGEFDGRSLAQARSALSRAGYAWDGELRAHVASQIANGTYAALATQHLLRTAGVKGY